MFMLIIIFTVHLPDDNANASMLVSHQQMIGNNINEESYNKAKRIVC